jgi:hypothetical protein
MEISDRELTSKMQKLPVGSLYRVKTALDGCLC